MGYADLREFVKRLEKEGELKRVKKEVDPVLEIAEVAQRLRQQALNGAPPEPERLAAEKVGPFDKPGSGSKAPTPFGLGPALLFEKPKGSRYPLLINTFGSVRRMALAFEVEKLDDVAARIRGFMDMQTPQGLFDKIKMLPKLAELGSFFPKSVKEGACKEIVRKGNDVNLLDFPILKCWPLDGGRFITFPLVFTKNPETGKRNVGMYRMQIYDQRTTGMHWQTQKHGAEHFRRARAQNPEGRIPVSVAIGSDPATTLGGILPIPPDLDEMMFSGFLKREPVEMVKCETNELEVPANAEIVLEGYVNL
ncbi:MAG TPA: UbiD family decarboxylase domain-containing protein, partial [Candidatus Acidoferrum sp.]|nr:UbiD family decarboxylase domain-containing protein [Candidatus Acidoferrum sp.]